MRAGKFDVAGAVGAGSLQVTKSYEVGQPYVGITALQSGEIAEDLAAYLCQSEQIPSVVALGVLAGPNGVIARGRRARASAAGRGRSGDRRAGRERALAMPSVTSLVSGGADAQALLQALAGNLELRAQRTRRCLRVLSARARRSKRRCSGLGGDELRSMAAERETEATCEFCKKRYVFTSDELRDLAARSA